MTVVDTAGGARQRLTVVPFDQNPLAVAAADILAHQAASLPDLTACEVVVAEERCAPQLRAELLRHAAKRGCHALLGPRIERFDQWLNRTSPLERPVLNQPAQELVLAEALRVAAPIYPGTDPWLLAEHLLSLFDELTRYGTGIPYDAQHFSDSLRRAYDTVRRHPPLEQEASILQTLWHAWRKQLGDDALLDPATAHHLQLQGSRKTRSRLWFIGFTKLSSAEVEWLRSLLDRNAVRVILHGAAGARGYHPDAPISALLEQLHVEAPPRADSARTGIGLFLDAVFAESGENLRLRAQSFAARHPKDPVAGHLAVYRAADAEDEAQAAALQVRRWLLAGVQPIALVTEDRRIARRVRALLEASQIALEDAGGWALSTTSAAAALERWLETVEEDFPCEALVDVLKSPFVAFSERDQHLAQVRRLEQDIILHENIARGLLRYRRQIDYRNQRLPDWSEPVRRALHSMLDRLEDAAAPLLPLLTGRHAATEFVNALDISLNRLGALDALAGDIAGRQLLDALANLAEAAGHFPVQLAWSEFRTWLGRHLERASFRSPPTGSAVMLMTLEQTRLQSFGAVVVAGCSRDQLPGAPACAPFFNQRVRAELGLPTWLQSASAKLHHFCRTLEAAQHVLLTCHREQGGEPVAASPWLELLEAFHRNAFKVGLDDPVLIALAHRPEVRPASPDTASTPGKARRPTPRLGAPDGSNNWSVYTHQRLIDCPYRFFVADALKLKPQDEVRESLSKSDYGALVHRILQAFASDTPALPGPWAGPLHATHRQQAHDLLNRISGAVFAEAIRENFQARSWLKQWLALMPHYLDWEIERRSEWQIHGTEIKAERMIGSDLRITGRIDRVDQRDGVVALVDYKTGRPPRTEEVLHGEAVQLPSYALLIDGPVARLEYLELARDRVIHRVCAEGDALNALLTETAQRLVMLSEAVSAGAALPAWGDRQVCDYCEFSGVCRREMWLKDTSADA